MTDLTPTLTTSSVMISWQITNMGTADLTDFPNAVVSVDWQLTGEQLNSDSNTPYTANRTGTIKIKPIKDQFTPFDQLTENQVINWINVNLGYTRCQELIQEIISNIDYQKNPIQQRNAPWA